MDRTMNAAEAYEAAVLAAVLESGHLAGVEEQHRPAVAAEVAKAVGFDGRGAVLSIAEAVAKVKTVESWWWNTGTSATVAQPEPVAAKPAGLAAESAAARARIAQRDAEDLRALIDGPNPWKAGSINLTRQGVIANRDPATAARLRAAAGL